MGLTPPLIDSYFKTQRAKKHLDDLKIQVSQFLDQPKPYTVSVSRDTERNSLRYRVVFEQPHVWIYLIAGDVFQCLRCALDQAVWWFASQSYPDPEWTQFPIFGEANAKSGERFARHTKGVPDKAVAVIESLQPYNRPNGTPLESNLLWQLNEINRIDKHRRISVRATGARIDMDIADELIATDDGCEVIIAGAEPAFEPRFTPMVVFGDRRTGITMQIDGIERLYTFVAWEVVPRFASCV